MRQRRFQGATVHVPLAAATFEEFFAGEYPRLVPILHALIGDRRRAETLAASVLFDVRRRWSDGSGDSSLAGSVRHTAIARATRRRSRPDLGRFGAGTEAGRPDLPDRELWDVISRLPRQQRWALVLHYVGELPLGDVATVIDSSPSDLTTLLTRARRSLAQVWPSDSHSAVDSGAQAREVAADAPITIDDSGDTSAAETYDGHIDTRLRESGAAVAAMAPSDHETADALLDPSHHRRRPRWIAGAAVGAAAGMAVLIVVVLGKTGDDPESAAGATDVASAASTSPPPSTSPAPSTVADLPTTTPGRTEVIEPVPDFDATYDSPTGYLWISSNWNWDGENGSCITVSRELRAPRPAELERPTAPTGCVDGSRSGIVLTTLVDDRLIHFRKDQPAAEWSLVDASSRETLCGGTADQLGLEPGALYEITCADDGPLVRRFPSRPEHELSVVLGERTVVAEEVFRGDDILDEGDDGLYAPPADGLTLYLTADPSVTPACLLATVEGVGGWHEGCGNFDTPGGLLLVSNSGSYVIRFGASRFTGEETSPPVDGSAIGCPDDVVAALPSLQPNTLWSGLGCAGQRLVAVQLPMTLRGGQVHGEVMWLGDRAGPGWQRVRRLTQQTARDLRLCDGGFPCTEDGQLVPFPVTGASIGFGDGFTSVIDVTEQVRNLVGGPTDLGTIGIRVSEDPPGADERRQPPIPGMVDTQLIISAAIQFRGEELRVVSNFAYESSGESYTSVVIWAVRATADDWTVRAAFRITTCFDDRSGESIRCGQD